MRAEVEVVSVVHVSVGSFSDLETRNDEVRFTPVN